MREIRRWRISGGLFIGLGVPLNYQAFTNDSLTLMYEGVRGALASDDTTKAQGGETRFRVRETPDGSSPLRISILKCSSVNVFRSHRLVGRSGAPRLRQLAGRYPMAVAGLLIAISISC